MQDIAEQQGLKFVITFLDWGKALDKVQHDKLYIALRRLHEYYIEVIKNCYRNRCFFVEGQFGRSSTKQR